jgi:DnaJ family protein C protein 17
MMMRLKNAQREKERKALEEELIREDDCKYNVLWGIS